ncbi:hypothetical protein MYX75_00275 [Acidobacteria bacterium AH-259-A15]|nr:hypothetical protein [Acidobacteria bacterium AH-259-A15]
MRIMGVSCFYHDAAAALAVNGKIVAAAQQERFSRVKHDPRFPIHAALYCLEEARLSPEELDLVVFYDKLLLTFDRLLSTYFHVAPRGVRSWIQAIPRWLSGKLFLPDLIRERLHYAGDVLFCPHHLAHAASAFYPSPFESAAILTIDGVGEWATSTIGYGEGNRITLVRELRFPDSLGLLYSAFTYFCGFKVNSGEYKLMGLAPYGEPKYLKEISQLAHVFEDGSIRLNMDYFGYLDRLEMINHRFAKLFGGSPRKPESAITRREMDLAASIQKFTEEVVVKMARFAHRETGARNLCLAGGVALNCVANGVLLREQLFRRIWIQPAAGDAGGALGAALLGYHGYHNSRRMITTDGDGQKGSYLGPSFSRDEIRAYLDSEGFPYYLPGKETGLRQLAEHIAANRIVGFFSGRMEFGPRALGSRSILGNAQNAETQRTMNLKIKYRESFRPFAPAVPVEKCSQYFELDQPSPYMLLIAPVRSERRMQRKAIHNEEDLIELVNQPRSDIPAVTHWDYSARIQTVDPSMNLDFHQLLTYLEALTGCAVVVNTSFNVRGEPIVCTPQDAYRCFMRTQIDVLYLDGFILLKEEQPAWQESTDWRNQFVLD